MAEMAKVAVLTEPRMFDYREVEVPEIGPDDGILRVEAAGLCGTDWEQYLGHLDNTQWAVRPIIPGHEILGWIDKVGPEAAKRWDVKEGDRVTVEASIPCGQCFQCQVGRPVLCKNGMGYGLRMGFNNPPHLWGGYATHMYLHPGATLHKAPSDVPTDIMSLFNPMSNAVRWAVERPETGIGDTIVIEGPGQRGLLAVVAAREAGAGKIIVTGTKSDTLRLSLARELGADATVVVDDHDPVEQVIELTDGKLADIVVDVSAFATKPITDAIEMVRPGGKVVVAGLKSFAPIPGFISDKLITKEIAMLGVLSSSWSSVEKSIDIIRRKGDVLKKLCTHHYPVDQADMAVKVLGREVVDGPEAVHVHIDAASTI
jgi:threonine dehydrogenase-like Zn-dependent dehydrogenase